MAPTCQTCIHPQREAIDRALLAGASLRDVAGRYGLGKSSIHRHVEAGHVSQALVKAHEAAEIQRGRTLWERHLELVEDYDWSRGKLKERIEDKGYDHDTFIDFHQNAQGRSHTMRFELEVQQAILAHEREKREQAQEGPQELSVIVAQALEATLALDLRESLNGSLGVSDDVAMRVAETVAPKLLQRITERFHALAVGGVEEE